MVCDQIQSNLPAYQDGELSAEIAESVRNHLLSCVACQKEATLLAASWERLGELKPIKPSPQFEARFWAKVRQEDANLAGVRLWWTWKPLVPAVMGLMGLVVILVLGVTGGRMLFENQHRAESALNPSPSIFTSPFPINSLEQLWLEKKNGDQENG